jgi:hypothetical protein
MRTKLEHFGSIICASFRSEECIQFCWAKFQHRLEQSILTSAKRGYCPAPRRRRIGKSGIDIQTLGQRTLMVGLYDCNLPTTNHRLKAWQTFREGEPTSSDRPVGNLWKFNQPTGFLWTSTPRSYSLARLERRPDQVWRNGN